MLPTHFWGGAAAPYQIDQSLRFNSADSAYLNRTPTSAGNRKTWTWSGWVKRSTLTTGQWLFGAGPVSTDYTLIRFGSGGSSNDFLEYVRVIGGVVDAQKISSAVYRDTSAWYHIVVVEDAINTISRIYVNGSEISYSTNDNPSNVDGAVNNTNSHEIGRYVGATAAHFSGYLSEINFIDGSALDPSSFGETDPDTGAWIPKRYAGSYTGNSFYLKFANGDGTDSSGLSNTWTANNFTTSGTGTDVMSDTPTTNWCTWNPLDTKSGTTLSDGNLYFLPTSSSTSRATIGVAADKWYWECKVISTSGNWTVFGIADSNHSLNTYTGLDTFGVGYYGFNGFVTINNVNVATLSTSAVNDTIGVAVDLNSNKIWFSKNGTWMGTGTQDPATNQGGISISARGTNTIFPAAGSGTPAAGACEFNFGQRAFAYTPPTGYKALNTANLPEPTIKDGSEYFNTVLWTGNTSTTGVTQAITGVGFQPDFVWAKTRNQAFNHFLFDSVRGVGASGKRLASNNTSVEATNGEIDSFDSDGFTVNYVDTNSLNWSSANNVAWCWKAGGAGSSIATGSIDGTNPTIASTVSANASAGFSIVSFTTNNTAGATVGHGLGVAPDMIIMKYRGLTSNWVVYHKNMNATPQNGYLNLNTTAAYAALTDPWNNTAPSSSVITMGAGVGSAGSTNYGTYTSVAYCFSEVAGYSKFGSYTGNGLADGPFVYCGFRPRFILIKGLIATTNWEMIDTARDTYNVADEQIFANLPTPYPNYIFGDVLSNGFKIRDNSSGLQANYNNNGQTYIFAAFAEHPFKYANAR